MTALALVTLKTLGPVVFQPLPNWPVLFANFASNFYEEFIYRGVILGLLLKALNGRYRWLAVLLSALLFIQGHLHYPAILVAVVLAAGLPQRQAQMQPRLVGLQAVGRRRGGELRLEQRPQRHAAAVADRRRQAVVGERPVPLLHDEAGLLEEAEVPRDAGLREAENAGQLLDVEAVAGEDPQEAEPRVVAQETMERGGLFHIHQSR